MLLRWKVLIPLLVSLPLILISLIFAAARWPAFDPITLRTPMPIRAKVAGAVMSMKGWGDEGTWDRVIRLDPNNREARKQRCYSFAGQGPSMHVDNCLIFIAVDPSLGNYRDLAVAQEETEPCKAEESMKIALPALKEQIRAQYVFFLNDLGRMAMECGDLKQSLASFQEAQEIDAQAPAEPGPGGRDERLAFTRGYLALVYRKMGMTEASRKACDAAYPSQKNTCEMDSEGHLAITGGNSEPLIFPKAN
jgi:hypothetical protein